jgi:hypothetical protein
MLVPDPDLVCGDSQSEKRHRVRGELLRGGVSI